MIKKMKLVEIVYEAEGTDLTFFRRRHTPVAVELVEISYNLHFGGFQPCQLFRVKYLLEFIVIVLLDFSFEFFLFEQSL